MILTLDTIRVAEKIKLEEQENSKSNALVNWIESAKVIRYVT